MQTIALVNMGNILTHSHQQEDGIIVLHAAVDHTPSDPIAHYTLANSYALIGDLNRYLLILKSSNSNNFVKRLLLHLL
jgi:predicted Zn-dependent protease